MVHVRFPKLGEACTAFYNEPGPKVTIGVVSVTELRAPAGIGPDVKTRPRRGTLHIEHERRNTPRTCLPGLLFDWDENMARDCNLFQPLDINFVQDSKGLFAEVVGPIPLELAVSASTTIPNHVPAAPYRGRRVCGAAAPGPRRHTSASIALRATISPCWRHGERVPNRRFGGIDCSCSAPRHAAVRVRVCVAGGAAPLTPVPAVRFAGACSRRCSTRRAPHARAGANYGRAYAGRAHLSLR